MENKEATAEREDWESAENLLGNVVENVLTKVGIAKLVKKAFKSCGCYARRQKLNRLHLRLTGKSLEVSDG